MRIKEGDEEKAAFITHRGLFEPMVMTFGLCNAPSVTNISLTEALPWSRMLLDTICASLALLWSKNQVPGNIESWNKV